MNSPFFKSFGYAARGIASTFRVGFNFKVMLVLAFCAIALGLFFAISPVEWAIIFICIGLVLGGECMNTALEAAVDLISPDYSELAGRAKDCAAGCVLLFSLASLVVALFIFIPRIIQFFA